MICVSIVDVSFEECLEIIKKEEMAEIRIDQLDLTLEQIKILFSQPTKLIATCREGKYNNDERIERLSVAVNAGASYIDIEMESDEAYGQKLADLAFNKGCKIIVSYHNFDETPPLEELTEITNQCFEMGADIAKIITTCQDADDCSDIMALYAYFDDLVAFGMGDAGKRTRVMALLMGAPFTYASLSLNKVAAPGQVPKAKIVEIIEQFNKL